MSVKLHKGDELIMVDYVGTSIVDFRIEILTEEGNDADLSIYEDLRWGVFAKNGGTLLNEMDMEEGLSVNENVVTLNRSKLYSNLRKGLTYYHHLIGVLSSGEEEVLLYGPMEAI